MKTFEIIKMDGLYCVVARCRIIAAFRTLKEAKEEVEYYMKGAKKS